MGILRILRRVRLIKDFNSFIAEKEQLNRQLQEKKEYYFKLEKRFQPQINELAKEADTLAAEFKKLYQQSQDKHRNGHKELAKEFSEKGRKIQKECENKNRIANEMRVCLKNVLKEIDSINQQIKKNEEKISALSSFASRRN